MSAVSDLEIQTRSGLTCLRVKVQPRASRSRVLGTLDGALRIALTTPPIDDRANRDLLRFLADLVGVRPSSLHLVSGPRSRLKTVGFEDISGPALKKQIAPYLV